MISDNDTHQTQGFERHAASGDFGCCSMICIQYTRQRNGARNPIPEVQQASSPATQPPSISTTTNDVERTTTLRVVMAFGSAECLVVESRIDIVLAEKVVCCLRGRRMARSLGGTWQQEDFGRVAAVGSVVWEITYIK